MAISIFAIDHCSVLITDVDRSRAFYGDILASESSRLASDFTRATSRDGSIRLCNERACWWI
jgi:hypothetical protein